MPVNIPIVIAAAGLGSRLGQGKPKALVEAGGRTIMHRLLNDCLASERDVRIIVGFHEEDVIDHATSIRRDIIFVRNPDYRDSSASHSFALAARAIDGPMIIVDGDLLIDPASWRAFRRAVDERALTAPSDRERAVIGITPARTEDAVFTRVTGGAENPQVEEFTRTARQQYEWCNTACVPSSVFSQGKNYVYECCGTYLPLPGFVMNVAEIDTPADLAGAEKWLASLGK